MKRGRAAAIHPARILSFDRGFHEEPRLGRIDE